MMRARTIGSGLLVALLLAGCAAKVPDPGVQATDSCDPDIEDCSGSGDDETFEAPADGEWTGTVTYVWSTTVTENTTGVQSLSTQTYEATVEVSSTQADIGAWDLTGVATVKASRKIEFASQMDTPLGPCNIYQLDDVPMYTKSGIAVTGGLEARGDLYQFHLEIPLVLGAIETSVRDDTGCNGGTTTESHGWDIAPTGLGGSGDYVDQKVISGSNSPVNPQGKNTTTWDLRLN